jgi:nucleotide-binding universal stress UspA family protein
MDDAAPILIGYDGSDPARRAVREAAELFGSRLALVVTVWEPKMVNYQPVTGTAGVGMAAPVIDDQSTQQANDALRARADRIAQDGAQLARSGGLQAEALALADERNAAKTIVELARGATGGRSHHRLEGSERPAREVAGQ